MGSEYIFARPRRCGFEDGVHEISKNIEVVLADLGNTVLADPDDRCERSPKYFTLDIGTIYYRPPDMLLGNSRFGADFDMWSFGCLAWEMYGRTTLFDPQNYPDLRRPGATQLRTEGRVLETQFRVLGVEPGAYDKLCRWLRSFPFYEKFFGDYRARDYRAVPIPERAAWKSDCLGGPRGSMKDLVDQCLQWCPEDRATADSALKHPFFEARRLSVSIQGRRGKNGMGSIQQGEVDKDLLEYLQNCPTYSNALEKIKNSQAQHLFKLPVEPNSIIPNRLAAFLRAFRIENYYWLHQLTWKIRAQMVATFAPEWRSRRSQLKLGEQFMSEELADTALVYMSAQRMKMESREDGWHTDSSASLLHCAITISGSHELQVKVDMAPAPSTLVIELSH